MINTPQLSQIRIYPIKSISGIEISSSWVEKQGLSFDRRLMVADLNGEMVTAREHHHMLRIQAVLKPNGLILTYQSSAIDAAKLEPLTINFEQFSLNEVNCQVWNDNFIAYSTSVEANDWFSKVLNKPVQLLFTGEQSNRQREKINTNVSFADGYPLLLLSEASLDELNRLSPSVHKMSQFRPNIVVKNTEAFAEDGWKRFRINEVEFEVIKPCMRCVMTTVDSKTGQANQDNEPLNTLSRFRADETGAVFFGQNVIAKNQGIINLDDEIEVLETQAKPIYIKAPERAQQEFKEITITINDSSFTGNNQQSILEQAEQAGFSLSYKCRAGFCGTCKITLNSGQVEQPETAGLLPKDIENNKVLVCCSIPKSDVNLTSS